MSEMVTIDHKGNYYLNKKKVVPITGKSGGYRLVGFVEEYNVIFKADVPRKYNNFASQTRSEIELWRKHMSSHDKKYYFANILDYDTYIRNGRIYHWHIQEVLPIKKEKSTNSVLKQLTKLLQKYRLQDIWGYKDDQVNWTIMNNAPVIYDWGVNDLFDCDIRAEYVGDM
jgi:hypothetical protein